MGTYTTNYNLFMPSVGETGWGDLVNGNFTTIDTTMKSLSNRITAVENEVNGALSCTSVTTSGKVTANGGLSATTGTFSGAVSATDFNRTTVHTVTSGTPRDSKYSEGMTNYYLILFVLPNTDANYTGSIQFNNFYSSTAYLYARLGTSSDLTKITLPQNTVTTLSFNDVDSVYVWCPGNYMQSVTIGKITLT